MQARVWIYAVCECGARLGKWTDTSHVPMPMPYRWALSPRGTGNGRYGPGYQPPGRRRVPGQSYPVLVLRHRVELACHVPQCPGRYVHLMETWQQRLDQAAAAGRRELVCGVDL